MSVRTKMGLDDDVFTNASRIIILKFEQQSSLGIIVDEVKEVVTLGNDQIDKVDKNVYNSKETKDFINGVGKNGEELISLLDLGAIIGEKENE